MGPALLLSLLPAVVLGWQQNERLWSAPWSWVGPAPLARLGYAVACGDLNGDGLKDMAFSSPFDTSGGAHGTVWVVYGSPMGWRPELSPTGPGYSSFKGENPGDHPGASLVIAPDLNGDGKDDLVVGAPDFGGGLGKVYIFFGVAGGWGHGVSLASANVTYVGVQDGGLAGFSLASGDVNGDGLADLLVGAPLASRGITYVILGRTAGWPSQASLATANGSLVGEPDVTGMPRAGFSVAAVPDLNGDGRAEILIGAPKASPTWDEFFIGKAYLVFGRPSGAWLLNEPLSSANKSFIGAVPGDELGQCVASAGDVDGDGRGDFLLSSPVSSTSQGVVYLWRGAHLPAWSQNTPATQASTVMPGSYASTGAAMGSLGDVNGDGLHDFAVGSPDWGAGYGKVYAFLGRPAAQWPPTLDVETSCTASWQGVGHKDWAGRAVIGGDVNGDGKADVVLGVDGSPFAGYDAGIVYVVPSTFGLDNVPPSPVTGFCAQVNLADSTALVSWNPVTQDQNGGPEAVLFYRLLRYRYPSPALVAQLPAVLHPQTTFLDEGWTPWTEHTDSTRFFESFDYYRLLSVDRLGNASALSPRLSVFQMETNIP